MGQETPTVESEILLLELPKPFGRNSLGNFQVEVPKGWLEGDPLEMLTLKIHGGVSVEGSDMCGNPREIKTVQIKRKIVQELLSSQRKKPAPG